MKQDKDFQELAKVFLKVDNQDNMAEFLKAILTPKERIELVQRIKIIKQLKQGISQREIAKNLGVGIATVTRGSKELHKGRFKNV